MLWQAIVILCIIFSTNGIVIHQHNKDNVTNLEGNCFGELSYFLCNCFNNTDHVDLQIMDGVYNLRQPHKPSHCLLRNKISISIFGLGKSITIYCKDFIIAILNSTNIEIKNLKLINCGHFVDEHINATFNAYNPATFLGKNLRIFAIVFDSFNITFYNISMLNTLGFSMVLVNALGTVELAKVTVQNTSFKNDPRCDGYNYYNNDGVDFLCSGSGVLIIYQNNPTLNSNGSTALTIDHCLFEGNKNIIPAKVFNAYSNLINTGDLHNPLPIIGAGCIGLNFEQHTYNVTANIRNSVFYSNNGTLTATVGIVAAGGVNSQTNIDNCLFKDNGRVANVLSDQSFQHAGILFYYLWPMSLRRVYSKTSGIVQAEMLTVSRCNFKLLGSNSNGGLGGAIQLDKSSPDSVSVIVTIRNCNFVSNEAVAGSAIYAKDAEFYSASSNNMSNNGQLIVNIENVNMYYNTLPPNGNIYHATGVIHLANCQINIRCNEQCNFMHNQPSVIYGQNSAISVSGNLSFQHNTAVKGGAMTLKNTFLYIEAGSSLYFAHNFAITSGGAIHICSFNPGIHAYLNICPTQFVGVDLIRDYDSLNNLNVNITFEENYVANNNTLLESINSNVFYLCSWFPGTSVGALSSDVNKPVINNTRVSVYQRIFKFVPYYKASEHLNILASTPCICDNNGSFIDNVGLCLTGGTVNLSEPVIPGWTFSVNLTALTVVGDVGYTSALSSFISGDKGSLVLEDGQSQRSFSVNRTTCTLVDYTVFQKTNRSGPSIGLITLAVSFLQTFSISFEMVDCPFGYDMKKIEKSKNKYGCVCDGFFSTSKELTNNFQCAPGKITRNNLQSWLSIINNRLEHISFCLPTYCNNKVKTFKLSSVNVLCANNHAGRACGGCVDGYSRVFGSSVCKQCSNVWLTTILLYGLLGVLLVFLIYKIQFTVTVGAINGLVFFCNCFSINEELLFNTRISHFSILRGFVSIINLDLGFELCFYDGMSQLAKTGLQAVFPVYLWLLITAIVFLRKFHFCYKWSFPHSAVSVLATIFLLSYSKILRTIIEVYSLSQVQTSDGTISVWQADPNVEYFTGSHIALFLIASLFLVGFTIPFALGFTFPKIVLRSKRLSRLFPLVDSFVAPYKDKYRYWFGIRIIVLILISVIRFVAFDIPQTALAVSVAVVDLFALVQAYIRPYKSALINILDLMFMEIFLLLGLLSLFFFFMGNTSDYNNMNITVTVFGYCSVVPFLLLIVYHIHNVCKGNVRYLSIIETISKKYKINIYQDTKPVAMVDMARDLADVNRRGSDDSGRYDYYQETLLEPM